MTGQVLHAPREASDDPIELVDTAEIPGGGQLRLLRRGTDYSIRFESEELMGNQVRHSEEQLAILTCERLGERPATMLIGGLGMGFTLGAALRAAPIGATIVVSELVPTVLAWAEGPLAHIFGENLKDPRVSIKIADVHDVIVRSPGGYDAIMLDVDNGPDGLISLANDRLYCNWGLRAAYAALRPAGVLAIWSAYADPAFADRLRAAGFEVDEVPVEVAPGEEDILWFATRPA